MNRREFIKTAGIGMACLMVGQFSMLVEGSARRMEIKSVKLYENGFMTQPFAKTNCPLLRKIRWRQGIP